MKKTFAILLIVLLTFSFGCVKKDDGASQASGKGFKFTGKNGLVISFEEDSPLDINVVNEPIEVMLNVINRGAVDLASGEINARLKGVAATEIFQPTSIESRNDEELLMAELDPTTTLIDLGMITYSPEEMFSAEYKPEIKSEICFPYKTRAESNSFWISNKQDDLSKGKMSSSDNSDAPVHATSLEEFKGTDKVRFQFVIENVGNGKIVDACFPEEESDETVEVKILEPRSASCETLDGGNSGEAKLINGRKIIKCSIPAQKDESYTTPLIIELSYNYDIELSKTITIENR